MPFGTDIHLSSNAVNQALGQSKAVVKDSAEAGGFDDDEAWNRTFLIVAFAFGALAPRFAQEGPKDRGLPAHQISRCSIGGRAAVHRCNLLKSKKLAAMFSLLFRAPPLKRRFRGIMIRLFSS